MRANLILLKCQTLPYHEKNFNTMPALMEQAEYKIISPETFNVPD
jgi:hypothetical protein